jgi:hypothetical protein
MTAKSKFGRCMAALMGVASLSACSEAAAPQSQPDASPEPRIGNTVVEAALEPAAPPATPTSAPLTETDKMMLEQAKGACKNGEVKSFLEAALRSKPVRLRYFTKPIKTATGIRTVESYSFPFQIMDYNYVTTESVEKAPGDWEYVQLDINQAQDERFRVDWVRIDFGKNGNDEGETPEDDKTYGPQGYLIFEPTADCWTLVEDGIAR